MGQLIKVTERDSIDPNVKNFVMDRGLTGMGLKEYHDASQATTDAGDDLLARRLFALGDIASVFIYDNVVVVSGTPSTDWPTLTPQVVNAIENLFIHYAVNRV